MNKKYITTGLILILVLATVTISGCIGTDETPENDKFTNAITFQGMTFYLPEGFESIEESDKSNYIYELYSDGTDVIGLGYYPSLSLSDLLFNMKSDSGFENIDESASYGGYSGYSADFTDSNGEVFKVFAFEKNGKALAITMSNGLNFNEYILKIIG